MNHGLRPTPRPIYRKNDALPRQLLLDWVKARESISLGAVEGLNNRSKVTYRKSYGFRTLKATNQYCPLSHDWEASGETNDPQFLQTSHTSTGKTSSEIAYYIGSENTLQAKEAARIIRRHWGIENELHWVLDMAFREDEARHRAKNTAQPQPPSATSL